MDPLALAPDPLPGLVLFLLSLVWLTSQHVRTEAIVELIGTVEP
jgi:hypothetical protein